MAARTMWSLALVVGGLLALIGCGSAPICGDGVVDGDEVCDDGVNDGRYGSCAQDCSDRAPHCGDGVIDGEFGEVCDEGVNGLGSGCAEDCRSLSSRCGDGFVDGYQGQGSDDSWCTGCCGAEFCDDAASSPFLCVNCNAYAPSGLRGCPVNDLDPFSVTASGELGTATLTRGYFAEVYGDLRDGGVVTGLSFVFIGDGDDAPRLRSALNNESWCLWSGLEFGAAESPKTEFFWLNIGGERELIEATLVLDEAVSWDASPAEYTGVARVYGHFEGAIAGDFVVTYCDEHVTINEYYPS